MPVMSPPRRLSGESKMPWNEHTPRRPCGAALATAGGVSILAVASEQPGFMSQEGEAHDQGQFGRQGRTRWRLSDSHQPFPKTPRSQMPPLPSSLALACPSEAFLSTLRSGEELAAVMMSAPVSCDLVDCLALRLPFHCGAPAVDVHGHSHESEIVCDSPCALVPDVRKALSSLSLRFAKHH